MENVVAQKLAQDLEGIFFGGNWTVSAVNQHMEDVDWEMAQKKVGNLNSIAALFYHLNYYVFTALVVLKDGKIIGSDKESFEVPPVTSDEDWHCPTAG